MYIIVDNNYLNIETRMKKVIFSDEEFEENLQHLNKLMEEAEGLPYPDAKELIFSILK